MEANDGFDRRCPTTRCPASAATTARCCAPTACGLVIAPFNFPFALAGGPIGAGAGHRQHGGVQGGRDTSLGRAAADDCLRDAGCRRASSTGAGDGDDRRPALAEHPGVAGITFTGSHAVGHGSCCAQCVHAATRGPASPRWAARTPAIVSRHADLERGGDWHRALGLRPVGAEMLGLLAGLRAASGGRRRCANAWSPDRELSVGDPTERRELDGPGDRRRGGYERYARRGRAPVASRPATSAARQVLTDGALARGFFVAPTVGAAPLDTGLGGRTFPAAGAGGRGGQSMDEGIGAPTPATTV
jgi:hypothetical protein